MRCIRPASITWPKADDGVLVRRAIVVLSDGNDTHSLRTLQDVIAAAQRSEIQIYALTMHKKGLRLPGDAILQRLADETGGSFFVAQSAKELQGVFAEIEQEMRSQYYVSFPPRRSTPGFHALRVEVRSPQNCRCTRVRATTQWRNDGAWCNANPWSRRKQEAPRRSGALVEDVNGSMAQVRGPGARDVVGHGEREQDEEPEDGSDDGNHRELGAVAQVHEEEHDQSAFDGGNQQRHNDVEDTQFKGCRENRDGRHTIRMAQITYVDSWPV